jgi:hypothetical protein
MMKSNAKFTVPPLHPLLIKVSQSTSSCSDSVIKSPVVIWFMASTLAIAEKAQQLPEKNEHR